MVIRGNGYSAPSNLSSWVVVDGNIVLSEASHSIYAVKAVYALTASTVEKSKGTDANRYSILSGYFFLLVDENIKLIHNMTHKLTSFVNRHLVASSSKSNRVIKSSNDRLPLFHNSKDFTEVLTAKSPATVLDIGPLVAAPFASHFLKIVLSSTVEEEDSHQS